MMLCPLITCVAMGATIIIKANKSHASGTKMITVGLRKKFHPLFVLVQVQNIFIVPSW